MTPTPTLGERLRRAETRLAAVSETARLDGELLMADALKLSRAQLMARLRNREAVPAFDALVERRLNHEPIAYILGEHEFWSRSFVVRPPLLVPRPETEHLIEVLLQRLSPGVARIAEVGTGTGCVAVTLAAECSAWRLAACDIRREAVYTAQLNARRHGVGERVTLVQGDGLLWSREGTEFDAIVSNPPYVETGAWDALPETIRRHEDPAALLAGADGLAFIRRLMEEAFARLVPGGLFAFELGMGQYEAASNLLTQAGFVHVGAAPDLRGIDRIAIAYKPM
ncbi:MAG: peptide chain release factor N(5)-glutamine methyltransferase [Candidatus Hydrogenedentota bacterium]